MGKIISRLIWFFGLVVLQIFVLNRIQWFGVATPFLYIYLILTMDHSMSRNSLMLWAFAIGLVVDILSNTFGIHAAASTFIAFIRPVLIRLFFLRDENELFEPGIRVMGTGAFWHYALTCTVIHSSVVCLLQFFSLSHPLMLLTRILACTLLTMVFVMAIEFLRSRKL